MTGQRTDQVLAVVGPTRADAVRRLAGAVGPLLDAEVREVDAAAGAAAVVAEADRRSVAAVVLAGDLDPDAPFWEIVTSTGAPVVVLPAGTPVTPRPMEVVLLPLDGTADAARAVSPVVHRLLEGGAHVIAMHVFDAATVPAFWDQAAHSGAAWSEEFLTRHLPRGVALDLRSGRPPEEVLSEAEHLGAGLVVLSWARRTDAGRARTVRLLLTGRIPVLLVGAVGGPSRARARDLGPGAVRGPRPTMGT